MGNMEKGVGKIWYINEWLYFKEIKKYIYDNINEFESYYDDYLIWYKKFKGLGNNNTFNADIQAPDLNQQTNTPTLSRITDTRNTQVGQFGTRLSFRNR
jgi:hypothetical protein